MLSGLSVSCMTGVIKQCLTVCVVCGQQYDKHQILSGCHMWPNQATRFEICCKGAVIYPCVQKVSDVIFFARKLMKHGRCAVVGGGGYLLVHKWIFSRQQTASVACSQRAIENVYAARVALLFSVKMSSHDSHRVIFSCVFEWGIS